MTFNKKYQFLIHALTILQVIDNSFFRRDKYYPYKIQKLLIGVKKKVCSFYSRLLKLRGDFKKGEINNKSF